MSVNQFYERYWQREGGSPAEDEFALIERQSKLQIALGKILTGSEVLDAGCGNGNFSQFLRALGYQVIGIDISPSAIAKARQAAPNMSFEVASLETGLPFSNNKFAAAWSTEVLEHVFDVYAVLAELNRVLAPNGLLVITTPYHGLIKNLAITLMGFERHYNPYLSHIRFYTRKSLKRCLVDTGFRVESWSGVGRRWPLWMSHFVVARKIGSPRPAPKIIG